MKAFTTGVLLLASINAFAISDSNLIEKCAPIAQAKMDEHAIKIGCVPSTDSINVIRIDNRTTNPYKYLMWEMPVDCEDTTVTNISAVTQYDAFDKTCY